MADIYINSNDAIEDKRYLAACRVNLVNAKQDIIKQRDLISSYWQGKSAQKCYDLLSGFANQIDELIKRNDRAVGYLDSIVVTFRDADVALKNNMR